MNALNTFLSPALLRALGFTLLHSLWQGALVAVAVALLLMLLHRHRAVVRYRVAGAALALVVGWAALTFGYYYAASQTPANPSVANQAVLAQQTNRLLENQQLINQSQGFTPAPVPGRLVGLLGVGSGYVEQHLPLLVGAWLLGMLAMTLRFLGGLAYVQRLRRHRVAALPDAWQTRLTALARRAGLQQPVQLLASALVPSPMVVGLFKPLVLLPMGAATGLAMQELEMILAHEVAHILRKDYLVNLLQAVAEVVFFYHPAVWFLSACLRTEREICCDDVATKLCGDSQLLAQALSSLAELTYAARQPHRLAVAAVGPDGSLLGRVRRLVEHHPTAPTFVEGFCAACVVLVSVSLLVSTAVTSLAAASPSAGTEILQPASDWAGQPVLTLPLVESTADKVPSVAEAALRKKVAAATPVTSALKALPATTLPVKILKTKSTAQEAEPRSRFEHELRKDGLLPDLKNYEFTLSASSLIVNGQLQPIAIFEKYSRIYEAETGKKLGLKTTYGSAHHEATSVSAHALRKGAPRKPAVVAPPTPPTPPAPPATAAPAERPDNDAILRELQKDGLVSANAKSWELQLTRAGLRVDGQLRSEAVATKYRTMLQVPKNEPGTANSVHITVSE
jgi:beta-lactamase regulating signal transducer with metallopeptidase domain